MTSAKFCPQCGTEVRSGSQFCANCGHRFAAEGADDTHYGDDDNSYGAADRNLPIPIDMPYRIPLDRVLLMTVLSFGLYIFYWHYLTSKHYRDYTREEAYPIWHALTLLVPIYSLFRTHAHMRVFRDLMMNAGLTTTISAWWAVGAILVTNALDYRAFWLLTAETASFSDAMLSLVLSVGSLSIVAWLLLHVQSNLNSYWNNLTDGRVANAKIGVGEVILAVIGVFSWFDSIGSVLA